jgi:hypothetical protein
MNTVIENTYIDFNESKWIATCEKISNKAIKGCGLSYDLFIENFSYSIDFALKDFNPINHTLAIKIAETYGYITADEVEENKQFLTESGYCVHGIDIDCCPAGCGG